MRVKTFFRVLRIASAITLFFFVWTFLPAWQVAAWAAEPSATGRRGDAGTGSGSRPDKIGAQAPATAGERFEKALEEIRDKIGKLALSEVEGAEEKAHRDHIRARKAEIETVDLELRKEFAATETKLKDANLPNEILDRHRAFVKHYESNLKELKSESGRHREI